jgi:parallel beta-helix repeat protein
MKKAIFLGLAFLLTVSAASPAAPVPAEYVPNEIIIKFRETTANTVEERLDELNARYRVREIKPLFKNFRQKRQKLKTLRRKSEAFLTQKERRILARLKRAPKDAKVPALDRIYKLELELGEGQSLEEAVEAYQNRPDIEYAELNYIVSVDLVPNDPLYLLQWPLDNIGQNYPASGRYNPPPGTAGSDINAPEAWDITTGSYDVVVAVIDSGVDFTHRDIDDNMWVNEAELNGTAGVDDDGNGYIDDIYGYDFANDDPLPEDDHGHGTHCAGIIAAEGDNGLDIAGVCWHAKIMALKFIGWVGSGSTEDILEAFYYAVENGADVTSNSWGGKNPSETVEDVINYAHSQGVITVASAGNNNSRQPHYPAYYDNAIAVAATNSNDEKAPFSNYGDGVDIAAPGVDILSLRAAGTSKGTIYDDYTTILSGTSMACPHITAVAALIISKRPDAHTQYVTTRLLESTDEIPSPGMGRGRVNAFKALRYGSEGVITLDKDFYWCDDIVSIELLDLDLIGEGTHQVTISTDGGDAETVLLTETGPSLGTFTGTISTSLGVPATEDGTVQVSHGQIITAVYYDVNDSIGDPAVAIDAASADCYPPVILNVHLGVPGREPRVTVETDEPTTARVLCGLACEGPYNIIGTDPCWATSRTIKLTGVSPETEYFFKVEVIDIADYITVDDNAGQCYAFTTIGLTDDIYVPAQASTIQEAVDNSWDNRTVWVADGIYTGPENRDIDFKGKPITVKSENGPQNCIIDCNSTEAEHHRGFNFTNNEDTNSIIDGITITNGNAMFGGGIYCVSSSPVIANCTITDSFGGGIYCKNGSSPTIKNCTITSNTTEGPGSGIFAADSNLTITNCTICTNAAGVGGTIYCYRGSSIKITNCTINGNSTGWGGAIFCFQNSPEIINCTIRDNTAENNGGAIACYFSSPTIANCTIAGNSADYGGGIFSLYSNSTITNSIVGGNLAKSGGGGMFNMHYSSPVITNCTFAENLATNGSALAFDSSNPIAPGNLQATNCIIVNDGNEIWNNDDSAINITYSNVRTDYQGQGNINTDPRFVEPGFWDSNGTPADANDDFWLEGNYHLLPTSPCINAGDTNYIPEPDETDLDGNPRISGGRIDIGAYEADYIQAKMKFIPQTLNCTSRGNLVKAHFILPEGFSPEDIDVNKPAVAALLGAESEYIRIFGNDDGPVRIEVAFDHRDFCDEMTDEDSLEVTVIGSLTTGQYFYGTNTIRVINPR